MFRVYFTNFDYFADASFDTQDDALRYARRRGFEASIYKGDTLAATWTPISGTRLHRSN